MSEVEQSVLTDPKTWPICIYHADCFDGTAAALAVWKYFKGMVEMVPCAYDYKALDGVGAIDREVYIVDFSLPATMLECLCKDASYVTLIDHHLTAKKDLIDSGWKQPENLSLIFSMENSGCVLTWKFFFPDKDVPPLLQHIEDRDLWKFRLADTKLVMAGLGATNWKDIASFAVTAERADQDIFPLILAGNTVLVKQRQDVEELLKAIQWRMIAGVLVPVVNCPYWLASEVGNALMNKYHPDFAATYCDSASERKWSLRSMDDCVDVSTVAKNFGGGGHRNAAGFSTPHTWMFPTDPFASE